MSPPELVVGVDACRGGWLFVACSDGEITDASVHTRFRDGLEHYANAAVVGVDIPIGISRTGGRLADREARKALSPRGSTVFEMPPLPALQAGTYEQANQVARRVYGKGLSQQAYAIRGKVLELEDLRGDLRLYEVHPELSFAEMAGAPLLESKHTWAGLERRRTLLTAVGLAIPDGLDRAAGAAAPDDVLDAAAAAWSAGRILVGDARSLPTPPEIIDGRQVAIWR